MSSVTASPLPRARISTWLRTCSATSGGVREKARTDQHHATGDRPHLPVGWPERPRGPTAAEPARGGSEPHADRRTDRQRVQLLHLGLRRPDRGRDGSPGGHRPPGHRALPDPPAGLHPDPTSRSRLRGHHRQVRRSERARRRVPLPGPHHRALRYRGDRQHRRRGHRHPLGRPGGAVLDVDDRGPGNGGEVRRGHPRPALPRRDDRPRPPQVGGIGLGRADVLHRARARPLLQAPRGLLRWGPGAHRFPHRQRGPGQHRGRHSPDHLRGAALDHRPGGCVGGGSGHRRGHLPHRAGDLGTWRRRWPPST